MQVELNWSFCKATIAASKLSTNWQQKRVEVAKEVAYLVKYYSISLQLIVNTDQSGSHLLPTRGIRTWEGNNSNSVAVTRIEDRRQATVCVLCSANGNMLSFLVIFSGRSSRNLPRMNEGCHFCEDGGWHINNTPLV